MTNDDLHGTYYKVQYIIISLGMKNLARSIRDYLLLLGNSGTNSQYYFMAKN